MGCPPSVHVLPLSTVVQSHVEFTASRLSI